jgi:hypothetical protein
LGVYIEPSEIRGEVTHVYGVLAMYSINQCLD